MTTSHWMKINVSTISVCMCVCVYLTIWCLNKIEREREKKRGTRIVMLAAIRKIHCERRSKRFEWNNFHYCFYFVQWLFFLPFIFKTIYFHCSALFGIHGIHFHSDVHTHTWSSSSHQWKTSNNEMCRVDASFPSQFYEFFFFFSFLSSMHKNHLSLFFFQSKCINN